MHAASVGHGGPLPPRLLVSPVFPGYALVWSKSNFLSLSVAAQKTVLNDVRGLFGLNQ
jgi:hypothetical protein